MKPYLLVIALLYCSLLHGQFAVGYLLEEQPLDSLVPTNIERHAAIKPAIRQELQYTRLKPQPSEGTRRFSIQPLADLNGSYSDSVLFRIGAGFMTTFQSGKWYARIGGVGGIGTADSVFNTRSFYKEAHNNHYAYADLRGRVAYTPNEIFHFQVGLDNNFIGEGNRSLFLSDYSAPYPFALIRTQFWRLEYTVLYQFFREQSAGQWKSKNATTHYLSVNPAKWLNVGIFETVLFQPKDTLLNRGYEAEYLNPVIFFRPQEYSLGSADNVLLGLSMSAYIGKHTLYSQLILDEFSLSEIKNETGWWANKFGVQVGLKGRFSSRAGAFFYRTEYNFIRPYTYAHVNETQNYAHQGFGLAHPFGGNFHELLGEVKWQRNNWQASAFIAYYLKGLDKDGFSYGGDLYQSYNNRPYEYGHFTGQGRGVNTLRSVVSIAYRLLEASPLDLFMEHHFRYTTTSQQLLYYPVIGLRTRLWNDYRNY